MNTSSVYGSHSIGRGHPWLLFATLMLGLMSQALVFSAYVSALPQMAHDLGSRGEFMAQMTVALAALGLTIGAVASGWIVQKAGTRVTLLTSVLIYGSSGAGGLVLRDPAVLLATRFAIGLASACMVTTCMWGIAAEYEGNRRARALGISNALSSVTALTGTVTGGYLAQHGGWSLAFVQYPAFGLVGLLLTFASLRQVRPKPDCPDKASQPYFKRLLPFYLVTVLLFAVAFMGSAQFAFLLEADGIRDAAGRSLIMGTITAVAALISFFYGALQRWLTVIGTFIVGSISMAIALAAMGLAVNAKYAFLSATLMGIYVGLVSPYLVHVVIERTDPYSRARAIGLLSAFGFLGGFLNPLVFATLSTEIGLRDLFLIMAVVMAVLALGAATNLMRRRGAMRERAVSH